MTVEELLEKKGIEFRTSGRDLLVKCLNPEHEDRNPSMRVDKVLGIFNCLSCGFKGNIFRLFDEPWDKVATQREKLRRKITEVRVESVGLRMPEEATPYVGSWRDIRPETYIKFNAFKSHKPEFLGRIVFPITDITGKIVCFQGRDDTGTLNVKYMNYPRHTKLPLFPKVSPNQGRVIIVEGIFDMLNLHDKGLENTICIFGVNSLNKEKLTNMSMQGITGIDIMFDADSAGEEASENAKKLAEEAGFHTRVIKLSEGSDPGMLSKYQVTKLSERLYG
jgi:DNA primase